MFQDSDFVPSEITDQPNPEDVTEKNQASTHFPYSYPTQSSVVAANLNLDEVALVPIALSTLRVLVNALSLTQAQAT